MGKTGKICAPVILVLAIAAVVLGVFLMQTGKKASRRAEILAGGLSATAKTLDSGSGESSKATYQPAGKGGKESGTLGWEEFRKGEDGYASSVQSVDNLAQKVLEQRAALIGYLVNLGRDLNAPGKFRPDAEALADLTKYEGGANGLSAFVNNLNRRDNVLRSELNRFLGVLGVNERYNGDIPEDGSGLSQRDRGAFTAGARAFNQLRDNARKYEGALKNVYPTLNTVRIPGVAWTQLSGADSGNVDKLVGNVQQNLRVAREQLQRINQLTDELKKANEKIAQQQEQLRICAANEAKANEIIEGFYKRGLGMDKGDPAKPALTSYDQVNSTLAGRILGVDEKYGFVVVSVTQSDAIEGLKFTVHRKDDFLGTIRLISLGRYNSLAVVDHGSIGSLKIGDTIIVASPVLQDKIEK